MKGATLKGFNTKEIIKDMIDPIISEQTELFIEYAKEGVVEIAKGIQSHGYSMDRRGNLLDSLCWVVSYNGEKVDAGFYRDEVATRDSYLHELYGSEIRSAYPVFGRALAEDFIERWGKKSAQGQWVVAFGILAPYWGYWEVGHHNKLTKKFEQFKVMAEFFDKVTNDLKPSATSFWRSRPHYEGREGLQKRVDYWSFDNADAEKRHFERWPRRKPRKKR